MASIHTARFFGIGLLIGQLAMAGCASSGSSGATQGKQEGTTYSEESVVRQAEDAFGEGAEGIGEAVKRVFKRYGEPNALIRGEEAGAAFVGGLRYGKGQLSTAGGGGGRTVYWQSPTVGLDAGGNAAKTFIMVYRLASTQDLFQRFPAVDGNLYVIGGVGLNYNQADETVLAVIRAGVGWRAGISIGYLKFTPEATANPF